VQSVGSAALPRIDTPTTPPGSQSAPEQNIQT
jgi:hypothetical protein